MKKKNEVYDFIVERLIRAHYAFGERILVKELAGETGVSRQPIMTALNRLAGDGFVQIIPQVGCQVVSPSRQEIADFFMMFQRMEGLLAELAAARRTTAQLRRLKTIQATILVLDRSGDDSREYAELNRSFHTVIHEMAHSPLLDDRQRANFNMSDFFITHSIGFTQLQNDGEREHDLIIDAIERQASERARAFTEMHINSVGQAVLAEMDVSVPAS